MRQALLLLLLLAETLSLTDARAMRLVLSDPISGDARRGVCHTRPARLLRIQLGSGFNQTLMSLAEPDQGKGKDDQTPAEGIRNTGTGSARHSAPPANGKVALQRLLQRALEASTAAGSDGSSSADDSSHSTHSRHRPIRGDANYFAQNNATSANSPMPWSCQMETVWRKMPPGIFPPYVQTGRCVQRSCMFGACECVPKKYVMKILKRVPDVCNPIPGVGDRTRYEDAWAVSRIKVTVHCECSRRRTRQRKKAVAAS
ncbi:hypothetical protein NP493_478g02020 [Ridgeia piscesae]|uniref:CTCK domain-containing protein n=1 Tax=Ridgeia piscesae TaxID=27915 RepID=A0AAD9NUA2_RIDPI|nr:hypothetical protein NP493_478g02020 [Ridgeia piscesae]